MLDAEEEARSGAWRSFWHSAPQPQDCLELMQTDQPDDLRNAAGEPVAPSDAAIASWEVPPFAPSTVADFAGVPSGRVSEPEAAARGPTCIFCGSAWGIPCLHRPFDFDSFSGLAAASSGDLVRDSPMATAPAIDPTQPVEEADTATSLPLSAPPQQPWADDGCCLSSEDEEDRSRTPPRRAASPEVEWLRGARNTLF